MATLITMKELTPPTVLTTSAVTMYSAPTGTTTHIRQIWVTNETGADHTVTISNGTDAAGKRIAYQMKVPAHGALTLTDVAIIPPTRAIQAYADAGSALTFSMYGTEAF